MRALVVLIIVIAVPVLIAAHVFDGTAAAAIHPNDPSPRVHRAVFSAAAAGPPAPQISPDAMAFLHALAAATGIGPGEVKTPGRACWSVVQPPDGQACPQPDDTTCAGSPVQIGACMAARRGWFDGPGTGNQWTCVEQIGSEESSWDPLARGPHGAYGIPQALPGSKMAEAGPDWGINPHTQLRWMYDDYLVPKFGSPCAAQAFHAVHGWW